MPKPTLAVEPNWNTDAANRTTPSAGKIALGWEEGEAPSSSYFNWWQNAVGQAVAWVMDGSSLADQNAHLVETNGDGTITAAQINVTGRSTGAHTYGGRFVGSSGVANATGCVGIGSNNAAGVDGTGGNGGTSGHGVQGTSGTTAGAYGVRGVAAGTNNTGVRGEGVGTGNGGSFVGGATGAGLTCTGGVTSGNGITATGTSTLAGCDATGGPTNGTGVVGRAGGAAGIGVDGRSHASATTSGIAVRGLATADGVGVLGQSADGYGVVAVSDTTSPARSALRIAPQDADPTTLADGDVWHNSTTSELSARIASGSRRVLWRTNGQCYAYAEAAGPSTDNAATYDSVLTCSLASPNAPPRTGLVRIRVTAEVGRVTSAAGNIQIRVRDTTAGATAAERTIELFQATGTYERDVSWEFTYTLPASGARQFDLEMRRSGGSDIVGIRNMSMTIEGVF